MSNTALICLSQKPGHQQSRKVSAARQLLKYSEAYLSDYEIPFRCWDVRDHSISFFDGREFDRYEEGIHDLSNIINMSNSIIFSIPCYWLGVSGVAKNIFDILGGIQYDSIAPVVNLEDKDIGVIFVGGRSGDARAGADQFTQLIREMGHNGHPTFVTIDNPRYHSDIRSVMKACYLLPSRMKGASDAT